MPVPVNGGVPPVAVTVTVERPPPHTIGVALEETLNAVDVDVVTVVDEVQLFASVTVKV